MSVFQQVTDEVLVSLRRFNDEGELEDLNKVDALLDAYFARFGSDERGELSEKFKNTAKDTKMTWPIIERIVS